VAKDLNQRTSIKADPYAQQQYDIIQSSAKSNNLNNNELAENMIAPEEVDPFAPVDGQVNQLITPYSDYFMQAGGCDSDESENVENAQILTVDGVRIFECQIEDCQKQFPDHGSLRKHQFHHGERMFICPVEFCKKKFLDNSKLKRH